MPSAITTTKCVTIVMPAYNEATTVEAIATRVLEQPMVGQLVIVDDCSTDGTYDVLEQLAAKHPEIHLLRHDINQGKGAALRKGIAEATHEIIIIQDADLEYDPAEYAQLIAPITIGKADAVFGSRFIGSSEHRVLYYWHAVGNRFLTTLSNMLTNLNLTDMETCYKAIRREHLQEITIRENRFGFEPEITAKLARLGIVIYEVPISYSGRTYADGKKIHWQDGVAALVAILRYNLFP